ncbi:MAG TPA: hypothetical protein VM657_05085 [Sphingomonas sp.]|nr:hypothetical protein [Sphingomonas sp.]
MRRLGLALLPGAAIAERSDRPIEGVAIDRVRRAYCRQRRRAGE